MMHGCCACMLNTCDLRVFLYSSLSTRSLALAPGRLDNFKPKFFWTPPRFEVPTLNPCGGARGVSPIAGNAAMPVRDLQRKAKTWDPASFMAVIVNVSAMLSLLLTRCWNLRYSCEYCYYHGWHGHSACIMIILTFTILTIMIIMWH